MGEPEGAVASMLSFSLWDMARAFPRDARSFTLLAAGACTLTAAHLSSQLISFHLQYLRNRREQMAIIIIILMAPVYAVTSFIALVEMPEGEFFSTLLDALKECYEALVIAKFVDLMYSYVGVSPGSKTIPDGMKGRTIHHAFPVNLFQTTEVHLDMRLLRRLHTWVWQFVLIRPVLSVVVLVLQATGKYTLVPKVVINFLLNASVSLAVYTLLFCYHAFAPELASHKPLAKLLCVKGVVFFSFWQGLVISLLAWSKFLHTDTWFYSVPQVEEAVQNFLICVEMLFFAMAHYHAFSVDEYRPPELAPNKGKEKTKEEKEVEEYLQAFAEDKETLQRIRS
eukprot:SM000226S07422  [mRNA]  locus=s226:115156:117573:- [translate_table: standard]